jgi:hypothetical protein
VAALRRQVRALPLRAFARVAVLPMAGIFAVHAVAAGVSRDGAGLAASCCAVGVGLVVAASR